MKNWFDIISENIQDDERLIKDTLLHIKDQIGLDLELDDYFKGIKKLRGQKYFNVILSERTSESKDYDKLEQFANNYKTIKIMPNGPKRVSIFPLKIN